jgi:hypothetical protein
VACRERGTVQSSGHRSGWKTGGHACTIPTRRPRPRGRVPVSAPGGTVPPCSLDRRPPPARGPARRSSGIFASTAWMRQRSWCSPRRGVGRWGSVWRANSHRPRTTRRLRPDDPRLGLCQGWSRAAPEAGGSSAGRGQGEPCITLRAHSCSPLVLPRHRERTSQRGQRCHDPSSHSCCPSSPRVS